MVGDESLGKLARESKRYIWHTTSAQFAERRFHGLGKLFTNQFCLCHGDA